MKSRIVSLELGGKGALGFDTGLDSQAFAQAKLASFITRPGFLVRPGGMAEPWIPGGVIEREGTMVVWGPAFPGERLDVLLAERGREDEALEALRYWMGAWPLVSTEDCLLWPAGALIAGPENRLYPPGTIFFPPERLLRRCLEAEGPGARRTGAEQWVHPDLKGPEAAVFTAGAMLYRIFSGTAPFPREDIDLLLQDIREGVFLPLRFAAPGLEEESARLITGALVPRSGVQREGPRPSPEELERILGSPGSRRVESYIRPPGEEEQTRLREERERFGKKRDLTVNTKRFAVRNRALITAAVLILVLGGLIARSIAGSRAALPTTRGMTPGEVLLAYYGAVGELDHQMMEACVINKAGKDDISMVIHFFVISRVRQAYEPGAHRFIPAQEWLDAGSPPPGTSAVFGVSDLTVEGPRGDPRGGELRYRASYRLWVPDSAEEDTGEISGEDPKPGPPRPLPRTDELTLVLHKEAWRIAEIRREDP